MTCVLVVILVRVTCTAGTGAAQQVATVIDVEGTAEISHAGAWGPAAIGGPINLQDEIRTGKPGRLRAVFTDQSVLNVGDGSDVIVNDYVFDATSQLSRSHIRLRGGKIRPLVGDAYQRPGATYVIETATATAAVRGTEFVITYDPVADVTDVAGVTGTVEVHGAVDRVGHGVLITAQNVTTITRGHFPTTPQRASDKLFRQYLDGLEFIGSGRPESLSAKSPLLKGAAIQPENRPGPPTIAVSIVPTIPGDLPGDQNRVGVITQPPPFVGHVGNLGITF